MSWIQVGPNGSAVMDKDGPFFRVVLRNHRGDLLDKILADDEEDALHWFRMYSERATGERAIVYTLGIEECVAVWNDDVQIYAVFTEQEGVGYLGDVDTMIDAREVASNFYKELKA